MKHEKIESATAKALFGRGVPRLVEIEPRRPFRGPGEGLDETLYVCSGLLAIYRADNAGRRAIVALRYPDEAILPGGRGESFGVEALTRSSVAIGLSAIDRDAALRIASRNEAIAHEWLARQSSIDSASRVAHLLCETAIRTGQGMRALHCPFTQLQIAEITGQTSVNVNRVLAEFTGLGLIS